MLYRTVVLYDQRKGLGSLMTALVLLIYRTEPDVNVPLTHAGPKTEGHRTNEILILNASGS